MQTGSTSGAAPEFCSLLVLLPASPPERFLLGQTAEPGTAEQSGSGQKTAVHPTVRGTLVFTEVCHGFLPGQPLLWGPPPPGSALGPGIALLLPWFSCSCRSAASLTWVFISRCRTVTNYAFLNGGRVRVSYLVPLPSPRGNFWP